MSKYGQYCPVAKSLEILGDRWTLLIVRDLLTGTSHFNDLERGLPGVSRALLATRLRQLERAGIIEKQRHSAGRQSTEYRLSPAGQGLMSVISSLRAWGEVWAFGDPTPDELDPVLLMWWLRNRVETDRLPTRRVTAQFDFYGAATVSFWLVLTQAEATLCLTDPGFPVDLIVTADLASLYRVWGARLSYRDARNASLVQVDGVPGLVRAFPQWFGWDTAIPAASGVPATAAAAHR